MMKSHALKAAAVTFLLCLSMLVPALAQTRKTVKETIAPYDQAIAEDPNNATRYYNRGSAYLFLDEYEKSAADLNKAKSMGFRLDQGWINAIASMAKRRSGAQILIAGGANNLATNAGFVSIVLIVAFIGVCLVLFLRTGKTPEEPKATQSSFPQAETAAGAAFIGHVPAPAEREDGKRKSFAPWYVAANHFLTAQIFIPLGVLLLYGALAAVVVAVVRPATTQGAIGFPACMKLISVPAFWFATWVGARYSGRYIARTCIVQEAPAVVKLATIYAGVLTAAVFLFNNRNGIREGFAFEIFVGVVNVALFYFFSTLYIHNTEEQ